MPAAGGAPRDLAPGRHLHLWLTLASDLIDWAVGTGGHLAWDAAGAVVCPLTTEGQSALWRFPVGDEPEQVAGGEAHIHGYALGGGRLVTLRAAQTGVVELYCEDSGSAPRRLTRDGAAWGRALSGVAHEQVSIPGPAGPIRATLAAPRGAGRKALPLVLSIIGGPGGSWGPEPWLPDWALTAAGYARAAARSARVGELRSRLARGDPRGLGRGRRRGSARLCATGRSGRGTRIPSGSARAPACRTAAS